MAQTLRYTGYAGLSSGTFTVATPTNSWTLVNGLSVEYGPLTLRAAVPMYYRDPLLTARDPASAPDGAQTAWQPVLPERAPYLGDPVAQIGARARGPGRVSIAVRIGAKAPLTDSTHFGTGRWDVGAGVSLSRPVRGMTVASVDMSYWNLGDLQGLPLRNPVVGSAALSGLFGGRWGWIASATAGQSVVEGLPPFVTVGGGIALFGKGSLLSASIGIGLTESAADLSVGLGWSLKLLGR